MNENPQISQISQIGTAVVGPGKVAHIHARALAEIPQSRFVGVWGRSPERTRAFAAEYGVRAYADLEEMVADPAVEMVVICTPHPQHAEQAITAARAGVHVLVEKPMAVSTAECDRMIAAAAAGGVRLGVISQRRWYEPVQRVKAAIEAGKIGRPVLGVVTVLGWRGPEYYAMDAWRGTWAGEGGGVLVNQTSHQLDLLQWFMGPATEVFGYWANLNHPTIEVEDTAVAVLRFGNGALGNGALGNGTLGNGTLGNGTLGNGTLGNGALGPGALGNIVVSNSQNPGLYGKIHIFGSNGAAVGVQTDGGSMFVAGVSASVEPPFNDLWTVAGEEARLAGWQAEDRARGERMDVMGHYHALQIEAFIDAIVNGRQPPVPGEEGRQAVALFEAIYQSQRELRPIQLPFM